MTKPLSRSAIAVIGLITLPALVAAGSDERAPVSAASLATVGSPVSLPASSVTAAAAPVAVPARTTAEAAADEALKALSRHVSRTSAPEALRNTFEAYYRYRDENGTRVRKPYLYFVDLGLSNSTPRGWVFDMEQLTVVEGPFTVAHGRGSGGRNTVPTKFSNRAGSYASSLGLYLAEETYTFRSSSYSSVGLRLRGESGEFNDAARARGIVAHGAPYVTRGDAGRSEGCPAMEMARAQRLLPLIANGGVVFIYSPKDTRWLRNDPWLNS